MFKRVLLTLLNVFIICGSLSAQSVLVSRPPITPVDDDNGVISGESDRFGNFRGFYPADHFVLTGETTLEHIDVFGTTFNGNSNSFLYTGFTLHIFMDDGGQPDGLAYNNSGSGSFGSDGVVYLPNVADGSGLIYLNDGEITDIRINFTQANGGTPITLPAGEYWVSVGPRMPDTPVGDPSGRWNWQTSLAPTNFGPLAQDSDQGTSWFTLNNLAGSSMAWELTGTVQPVELTPNEVNVVNGTYVSGAASDLASSDNVDYSARRSAVDLQSRVNIEIKTTSPTSMPNELSFTLEASVFARSAVIQSIDFLNFDSGNWEQVDSRSASTFVDSTATVNVGGDLGRYVETGTNCMRARIRYQSLNPRQQFSANLDQAVWTIR